MELFARLTGIDENSLHPKFKLLRDEYCYIGAKKIVEDWASDFIDRDGKLAIEFQTTFHSALWELYLHAVLKHLGFNINTERNRPDFIIQGAEEFYIEAVVSEIKSGGTLESERTHDDVLSMLSPISSRQEFSSLINEAIVRQSNSIQYKLKKYTGYADANGKWKKGYKETDWVDENKPFVIAISSYDQINYGKEYIYSMLALLYGWYFDPETGKFSKIEFIKKPGTQSEIKLGIFNDENFRDVSAIFFCNTMSMGKLSSLSKSSNFDPMFVMNVRYDFNPPFFKIHEVSPQSPEHLLDGLYLFKNPNAKVAFSNKAIKASGLMEMSVDEVGFAMEGSFRPVVARYCDLLGHAYKELIKATAASNYNDTVAELVALADRDDKSRGAVPPLLFQTPTYFIRIRRTLFALVVDR
ncbi:hypothetical protein ACO0K0_07975 [Undibacterium sp. SXout11W]|uniref:hypothetical protein n=1 Tax=Undibacterium sp. SXout11W TaxID=3413050 RepID=UPI003BF0DF82